MLSLQFQCLRQVVASVIGLALELASPSFPSIFLALACLGSIARAITGKVLLSASPGCIICAIRHVTATSSSCSRVDNAFSKKVSSTALTMLLAVYSFAGTLHPALSCNVITKTSCTHICLLLILFLHSRSSRRRNKGCTDTPFCQEEQRCRYLCKGRHPGAPFSCFISTAQMRFAALVNKVAIQTHADST